MSLSNILINELVLVVDDDPTMRDLIQQYVEHSGGRCHRASSALDAIPLVESNQYDVAILDVCLNGDGSGLDLLDKIKIIDNTLTIILVTGYDIKKFLDTIVIRDIYALITKPLNFESFSLLLLQGSRATRLSRKNKYVSDRLKSSIRSIRSEKDQMFTQTLLSLSFALEQKDEYTKNHSEKVGDISYKLALEITDNELLREDIRIAGRLHDIGKIGIKDEILFKPGKLDDSEYEIIKKHPEMSYKIIRPVDSYNDISSMVLHHHERWDGGGYPHGLK